MAKRNGRRHRAGESPDPVESEILGRERAARTPARASPTETENALRPSAPRRSRPPREADRQESANPPSHSSSGRSTAPDKTDAVPDTVRSKFVQVGRDYYFADGARAFTDRGKRLTTPSENTEVIRSLIVIAQARDWSEVTVSGTERFRKEAWSAARAAGLEVRGYRPTQFEQERLVRSVAKREGIEAPASAPQQRTRERRGAKEEPSRKRAAARELIVGRLVDHGAAPYQHEPQGKRSYFVQLDTPQGDRTVWGVDLERAVRESLSQPKPGDEVGLRQVGREPLTFKAYDRNSQGTIGGSHDKHVYRNRWVVETREFLEKRAAAARTFADAGVTASVGARQHPELLGSYLQVRGAEEYAASRIREAQDQRAFVALVRRTLVAGIASGAPLPSVRLRERSARQDPPARRPPERVVAPERA